jgi:hypothetical protein
VSTDRLWHRICQMHVLHAHRHNTTLAGLFSVQDASGYLSKQADAVPDLTWHHWCKPAMLYSTCALIKASVLLQLSQITTTLKRESIKHGTLEPTLTPLPVACRTPSCLSYRQNTSADHCTSNPAVAS